MRNNLRSPEKALKLVSSVEPLTEALENKELLDVPPTEGQFRSSRPSDAADGQRWMPASALAVAGGISLLVWVLVAWAIGGGGR